MTKDHLKRIATPRTWKIDRKANKFVVRPHAGAHSFEFGFALGLALRDKIGVCSTLREAQKLLNNTVVNVNGKRRRDRRDMVGLFDVISIVASNENFEIVLAKNGKLSVRKVAGELSSHQSVARVVGKSVIKGGKIQVHLHNGRNILYAKAVKPGDSVVLSADCKNILEVMPLKEGARVLLMRGKHTGSVGTFESAQGDLARYVTDEKKTIETATQYLFVVPKGWNN